MSITTCPHLDVGHCLEVTLSRGLEMTQTRLRTQTATINKNRCGLGSLSDIERPCVQQDKEGLDNLIQYFNQSLLLVTPIYHLPVEILEEIFHHALEGGQSPGWLMLVCRRWYNVVEGMPSVWSNLELGTWTKTDSVKRTLSRTGNKPLDVVIDTERDEYEWGVDSVPYEALAMAAGRASMWKTLVVTSLPGKQQLRNKAMCAYITSSLGSPMTQLHSFTITSAAESSPLYTPLLQNISVAASKNLKVLDTTSSIALYDLLDPQRTATICQSLTTLTARPTKCMGAPIDLLPHLKQIEVLDIKNIGLPIYSNESDIPCVRSLHCLSLHAVSIQWMGGRTFPQLESCTIIHPPSPHDSLLLNVDLPICTSVTFQSRWIVPLGNLHSPRVHSITISSNEWCPSRGSQQVIHICRLTLGAVLKPQILHMTIQCRLYALILALGHLSGLEELYLSLPRPSALGWQFFQALLAAPVENIKYSSSEFLCGWVKGNSEWKSALCPCMKVLKLNYQRWFRKNERIDIIPPLIAVSVSRSRTESPLHAYSLCFETPEKEWQTVELTKPVSPQSMFMSLLPSHVAIRNVPDYIFPYLHEACFTGAVFSTVVWPLNRNSDLSRAMFRILVPFLRRLKTFNNSKGRNGDGAKKLA